MPSPLSISDSNKNSYEVTCKLWKPKSDNMRLICNLNELLISNYQYITLNEFKYDYKGYSIIIYSKNYVFVRLLNYTLPFLYSDKQEININERETENLHNIKFKTQSYNDELLMLYGLSTLSLNYIMLDNCEKNKNTLNCKLSAEKMKEFLTVNDEEFGIGLIDNNFGRIIIKSILPIKIHIDINKKEDIYVGIIKVIEGANQIGNPIAFQTNITNIPNLNSMASLIFHNNYCYFKKTQIDPLYLLCIFNSSYSSNNEALTNELILENLHYKYNFRIQPYNLNTYISIYGEGSAIYYVYPEELNFKSNNFIDITFIVQDPKYDSNILFECSSTTTYKFSPYLICDNLDGMIKCKISISHFTRQNIKQTDYCYLYHAYHYYTIKKDLCVAPIKVILPPKTLTLLIESNDNYKSSILCNNGIVYFITNYDDTESKIFDASNIEEKTQFKTTFTAKSYNTMYDATCRLWKPKNKNLVIICHFDQELNIVDESEIQFNLNDTIFEYNDYKIIIITNDPLTFQGLKKSCPFIYGDEQIINVREEEQFYKLSFKLEEYNNEPLLLSTLDLDYINMNTCLKEGASLICDVKKEEILDVYNNQILKVYFFDETYGFLETGITFGISFNCNIKKKDIYVKITNLLTSSIYLSNYGVYSTNVTYNYDILNVTTGYFLLDKTKPIYCFMKKTYSNTLYILCRYPYAGNFSLGEIKNEIILDNINVKYNFRIQPVTHYKIIQVNDIQSFFSFVYPRVLNFYLNDSITVGIRVHNPEKTKLISLGSYSNYLTCEDSKISSFPYKRCIVDQKYFMTNKKQYYYFYYRNNYYYNYELFELSPIQVKLPKDNEIILRIKKENNLNSIKIGTDGILSFITNYNDTEKGVFYIMDEEKASFESKIIDENKNEYEVKCKLWSPYNNNVRIICNLNQNLKYSSQNIILKDITFNYNEYIIYIISDNYLEAKQLDYNILYLYSERQDYKIYDNTSSIKFTFNLESYANDTLYLYGDQNNYLILDKCYDNSNKKLICDIPTEKLDEIITTGDEYFEIGAINDNLGAYKLNDILPIHILRNCSKKIYLEIYLTKQIERNVEVGLSFGFETSMTNISNLITSKHNNFYLKKVTGKPLLFISELDKEQPYYFYQSSYIYMENHHWKYNFIIRPNYTSFYFNIQGYGSRVLLSHPEILNFSNEESLIIKFIMSNSSYIKNIKLNPDSSHLDCQDLEGDLKKCIVSLAHFRRKTSDNYNIYYSKYHSEDYATYCDTNPIEVILPDINLLEFTIDDYNNNFVQYVGGNEGVFYFITNYNDTLSNLFNDSEISKLSFEGRFSNNMDNKVINSVCHLWEPLNENIRLICKINDNFDNELQIIYLNELSIKYKEYTLFIYTNAKNLYAQKLSSSISFLYSDKQKINLDDKIDSYKLSFKKELYNKEQLILFSDKLRNIKLDCTEKNEEIICDITKDKITQIISHKEEKCFISQITNSYEILPINSILVITFTYDNAPKKEINIEIMKLLTPFVDLDNFIVYETNITDISIITTDYFNIKQNTNDIMNCLFKKNSEKDDDKLLLLCNAITPGKYTLGNIDEITLDDINILYNFKISKTQNDDEFVISSERDAIIYSVYPEEIDFNKKDSFIIIYETEYPERLTGIKLNNDSSSELECKNKKGVKECIVTQNHFEKSGDYYTYHDNSFGYKSISYEITTIKVTLKNKSDSESKSEDNLAGILAGSIIGGLVVIALIILLIWYLKRRNDKEKNGDKEMPLADNIELKEQNN